MRSPDQPKLALPFVSRMCRSAVLLSLIVLGSPSLVLCQDTLHARCTFTEFPLGPLRGYGPDTMQPMLGANCVWNFNRIATTTVSALCGADAIASVKDPFYYRTDTTVYRTDPVRILTDACLGHDVTVYMPGTGGPVAEYTDSWQQRVGSNWNDGQGLDSTQWKIQDTDAIAGSNYVLRNLTDGASSGLWYGQFHIEEYLDPTHVGSGSYEFVCYLDNLSSFTLDHNLPLYTIEYWGRTSGDTTWRLLDSTQITYKSYTSASNAVQPYTGPSATHCNADSLGNWSGRGEIVPNMYHVFKKTIDIRSLYNANFGWARSSNPVMVDVRVRTYYQWPMFVRCLRVRDWRAQQVLTGTADAALNSIIDSVKNYKDTSGAKVNLKAKGWVLFDEPFTMHFHTVAYMNGLLVRRGAPPLTALSPWNHPLLMRVFRSQTNTNPAAFFDDSYPFTGITWTQPLYKDPAHGDSTPVRSYSSDISQLAPMQSDVVPDSASAAKRGINVVSDYAKFTYLYQNGIIGYSSEDGTGAGWAEEFHLNATSSTAMDATRPVPFMQMGQAYFYPNTSRLWVADSLALIKYGPYYDNSRYRVAQLYADSIHYLKMLGYLNRHNPSATDTLIEDSLYDDFWVIRIPTACELLFQAWEGVLAGMKGWSVSNAFDDGIGQIGFLALGDSGREIKSQDRTQLTLRSYRWASDGLSLLEAWMRDSTSKARNFTASDGSGTHTLAYRCVDTLSRTSDPRTPFISFDYRDTAAWNRQLSFSNIRRTDTSLLPHDYNRALFYANGALGAYDWQTGLITKTDMPPAYGALFNAVRDVMYDELGPIGHPLSKLVWKGTLSWHKRSHSPVALAQLPIDSIKTRQISAFSNTLDADSNTYVDVSFASDPSDPGAWYVMPLNRRLWMDTTIAGKHPKGKIDFRVLSFKIKPSAFGTFYSSWPQWMVQDMATSEETVLSADSTFSVTLKPGQGKLFRIAPAFGVSNGTLSSNRWNNARHLAYNEGVGDANHKYWMVYERKGSIYLASPKEQADGISKRIVGTPADSLLVSSTKCHHPAIAINPDSGQGFGIVYSVDKAGATGDSTFIIYRHSNPYLPYALGPLDTLDKFKVTASDFFATPAISPVKRVNFGSTFYTFWVSWRHPNGGRITLVDTLGQHSSIRHFSHGDSTNTKFVTIASRVRYSSGLPDTIQRLCHVAFEEGNPGAIYYLKVWQDTANPSQIDTAWISDVSAGLIYCVNRTPCITVSSRGQVSLTWEGVGDDGVPATGKFKSVPHSCILRQKGAAAPKWLDFVSFLNSRTSVSLGGSADTLYLLPQIVTTELTPGDTNIWDDRIRIGWNDNYTNQIHFYHVADRKIGGSMFTSMNRNTMVEPSLEPSLAVFVSTESDIPQALAYRSPVAKSDSTFDARITRYDFPITPVTLDSLRMQLLAASIGTTGCPPVIVVAKGGIPTISHVDTSTPPTTLVWLPSDSLSADTSIMHTAMTWTNAKVRTVPFFAALHDTLHYQRVFRVGTYSAGDTSSAQGSLVSGGQDFVRMAICLRKQFDNTLVATLDTGRLSASGFVTSTDLSDSGLGVHLLASDTFYLSLEATRGDTTDGFALSHTESYGDQLLDILPDQDSSTSYKKATPVSEASSPTVTIIMRISPNPSEATFHVTIESPAHVPLDVRLFDLLGRPVRVLLSTNDPTEQTSFSILGSDLAVGNYFVRAQAGERVLTRRIELRR